MIEKQDSCYMAAKVARECAWGSSLDVQLAGAASTMCTKEMAKWPKRHRIIRNSIQKDCSTKWSEKQGTLAMSAHAHCNLNIDEVLWSLNEPAGT